MPLMITKKTVYETRADLILYIEKKEWSDAAVKGSFLKQCIQKFRTKNWNNPSQYVYYSESIDHAAFERNYRKTLKKAVRRGNETIAVSCEDEIGFILAKQCSKRFAQERDLRIWLCLPKNVEVSGSSIAKLERIFSENEDLTRAPQRQKVCDDNCSSSAADSLCTPIKREETDASQLVLEEDQDCAIFVGKDLDPPIMTQIEALKIRRKKAEARSVDESLPKETKAKSKGDFGVLREYLKKNDVGFKDTLLRYIDRTGKKDSVIYKKANVDRRLFSKIMNIEGYNPSKPTAIAFAIALELNMEETKDLIGRAGYTLSQASTFDRIIEFFIMEENYDIYEINEALFYFDQSLLGC